MLRVTSIPGGIGTIDPRRAHELRGSATTFFDEHGPGYVVLDCVDTLALQVGVERTLRIVDALHEEAATRGGILVVFVNPQTTNPRTLAWLERALDPFPNDASRAGVEDRIVA